MQVIVGFKCDDQDFTNSFLGFRLETNQAIIENLTKGSYFFSHHDKFV